MLYAASIIPSLPFYPHYSTVRLDGMMLCDLTQGQAERFPVTVGI